MFKVLSQKLRGTWTTTFEGDLSVEDFTDMDQYGCLFFLDKDHKTKTDEGALKIISCTKIRACFLENIEPRNFTYYCILLSLSKKPSFEI